MKDKKKNITAVKEVGTSTVKVSFRAHIFLRYNLHSVKQHYSSAVQIKQLFIPNPAKLLKYLKGDFSWTWATKYKKVIMIMFIGIRADKVPWETKLLQVFAVRPTLAVITRLSLQPCLNLFKVYHWAFPKKILKGRDPIIHNRGLEKSCSPHNVQALVIDAIC